MKTVGAYHQKLMGSASTRVCTKKIAVLMTKMAAMKQVGALQGAEDTTIFGFISGL